MSAKVKNRMDSTALGPDLRILDGIASWCGALHGSMPLADAVKALADGFSAQAGVLSRHGRNEEKARAVALYDRHTRDEDLPSLTRPLIQDSMGYLYEKARVSTMWFLSDLLDDSAWEATQSLKNWMNAREVKEIVIITLAGSGQARDFIELHFDRDLLHSERGEFESLTPTIVRSWAGRKPGLVTNAQIDDRVVSARKNACLEQIDWDAPILDISNPARLSRAEFRVCLMLSRGLSVKGVMKEVGTSEATVRSHLRSIYAKTSTSGMAELLYRVLRPTAEEAPMRYSRSA